MSISYLLVVLGLAAFGGAALGEGERDEDGKARAHGHLRTAPRPSVTSPASCWSPMRLSIAGA